MSDTQDSKGRENASDNAIRTSFSLDRNARERIRETSQKYGVPQAEIVNRAARLFEFVAERSLQCREKNLPMLRTLAEQVDRSLGTMRKLAPHLVGAFDIAEEYIWGAVWGEAEAIAQKNVYGAKGAYGRSSDLDFTDYDLIEKSLKDYFPELGPIPAKVFDIDVLDSGEAVNKGVKEIVLHYDPFGPLSSEVKTGRK